MTKTNKTFIGIVMLAFLLTVLIYTLEFKWNILYQVTNIEDKQTQFTFCDKNCTNDFSLEYHITPTTKPGMGEKGTTIKIEDKIAHITKDYPLGQEMDKYFEMTSEEKDNLIAEINSFNFFSLEKNYSMSGCADGKWEYLKIKIKDQEKNVESYCGGSLAISSLGAKLNEIFSLKD